MFFEKLKKLNGHYLSPNVLRISKSQLIKNYRQLLSIDKKIQVAPVLKSNAYGHGICEVGKILDPLNPPFFCVYSLDEAMALYEAGIKTKILIMGYVSVDNLSHGELPFSFAVYGYGHLKQILKYQPKAGIHIFVDTGMHREGILIDELAELLKNISKIKGLKIEGLMSHFGQSEDPHKYETKKQVSVFKNAINIMKSYGINPAWIHIANSSGLLNSKELGLGQISNLGRAGISLYDFSLRFITHIVQIKKIRKNEKIGYSFTYQAKRDMVTAILPVGYNDGVDRALSNIGKVKINGIICPIVGRVSMNITTVNVSKVKDVKVGDEVEIYFYPQIKGRITYEFYVQLKPGITRVVVD